MSEPRVGTTSGRWRVLGPLTALTVGVALLSLVLLFGEVLSWAFGRRGTPFEDFAAVAGILILGIAPAVVLLVLSVQRRPVRSVGGAVIAGIALLVVIPFFVQPLAETGARYADRLHDESLPLLPSETAFTLDEATGIAIAERTATLEFLDVEPEYAFEYDDACGLSTGIPGTMARVSADIQLSDWPKETIGTLPDELRAHWASLGYEATLRELDDNRVAVDFVSDGEPVLTGRALWEPTSLRFGLRIDTPCLRG